jgi:hypothetical protein
MRAPPTAYSRDTCAYCGSKEDLNTDHIPPRNLFPRPRPSNLICVSACPRCHKNTSLDDEYFRMKLCLKDDIGELPTARANWDAIFRSLRRSQARGLKQSFLNDIREVNARTPSGLHLRKHLAFDVDLARIRKVVRRIVRGLYFAEAGTPLGSGAEVDVHCNEDLEDQDARLLEDLKETILMPLAAQVPTLIGEGVFSYRFYIAEPDPEFSVWALTFYEYLPFLCLSGPPRTNMIERLDEEGQ